MDSLQDLLKKKDNTEPPEVAVIKIFLQKEFQAVCQVTVQQRNIVISVASSSLAGALRLRLHDLQAACQTEKRLMIRIGW